MDEQTHVWIRERARKSGKTAYQLQWIDPLTHKWKSRTVGTDGTRADREAAKLQEQLEAGIHRDVRRSTWDDFVEEHTKLIVGQSNRKEARRTLDEFGVMLGKPAPRRITFEMVEQYVDTLRVKGRPATETGCTIHPVEPKARKARTNSTATVNKKLRYLRAAFRKAVRRGYMGQSPMDGWQWDREEDKTIREVTAAEEKALLQAAEDAGGFRVRCLVALALASGGRLGELVDLPWDRVDLDGQAVVFTKTKGKKDRRIPIGKDTVSMLTKLKASTQKDGGPFIGLYVWVESHWEGIVARAGIADCTPHDLRRTYISRLLRSGAKLPAVQRLAGHASINTTIKHYTAVNDEDLRAAVKNLRKGVVAG